MGQIENGIDKKIITQWQGLAKNYRLLYHVGIVGPTAYSPIYI